MLNRFVLSTTLLCGISMVSGDELSQKTYEQESKKSEICSAGPSSMRVGARHITGPGVGYKKGYTTLETFLAPAPDLWSFMPFVDLRGHLFDDGKEWAANAGLGVRKLIGDRVYGINT